MASQGSIVCALVLDLADLGEGLTGAGGVERLWSEVLAVAVLQLGPFPLLMGSVLSCPCSAELSVAVWLCGRVASWPCREDDLQQAAALPEPAASP